MSARFTPLHVHSHYSLLQALPKIPELVKRASQEGCEALALTDLGNLYGAIEFIMECRASGIKPIIGIEAYLQDDARLLLYAENEDGYRNLLKLVTASNITEHSGPGRSGKPTMTRDMLREYAGGLIAVSPFLRGEIAAALRSQAPEKAKRTLDEYITIFGKNNFFLELSVNEEGEESVLTVTLQSFAATSKVPLVAAQEAYYLDREDRVAWMTMRKIENSHEEGNFLEEDYAFIGASEMSERFKAFPEALLNSNKIAQRCEVNLELGTFIFPTFPLPEGKSADEVLHDLCMEGMQARELEGRTDVLERLEYELGIIKFKGYAMYFLVVEDLIRFAREQNIYYNIRGSVAGSMTTYLLQITKIDPLDYKIPFERFLNPERPSAPDIDMDFADDRREEVINYARQMYGADHVAQIGTFGTMLARGVVRDVARAMSHPYGLGDRIAKEIPLGSQGFPMTLERALAENTELAKMYNEEEETREIIDLGKRIEGCARHVGVHAAGVVISPKPLVEYAPLQYDPKGGKIITQYDMYSVCEDGVGLTKFDFLGIRNLTILASAVKLIEKIRGITIDIEEIPMNDKKTFQMLARGETEGTFQLGGAGMTKWLVELKPSTIHDINAMVALYRPGPMENIPQYIERKHNPQIVSYLDPRMEDYLGFSSGVIVYQDDVLLTAIKLGGYSWLEADKLRKAMGKKIPAVMQAEKDKLIKSFISYGKLTPGLAEKLWKLIEPFAAYGFGKAHAASYGRVAYQTAYLKANYPEEYMCAVLTAESGNMDTIAIMVAECKRMNIPILSPDINESFGDFTVVDGAIRFGLYSIKNFGRGIADSIIAERKKNGPFVSLADFLSRVSGQSLNKKGLESLIQCGALDSLCIDGAQDGGRGRMLHSIELLLQYHRDASKDESQDSLFGAEIGPAQLHLPQAPEVTLEQRLLWEKELLGLYVSGHPLDKFKERLAKRSMTLDQLKSGVKPGMTTVTGGMIENVRVIFTRKGDQMAFITIADMSGSIEAVVFPKSYAEHKDIIHLESCVALTGKLNSRNGELSLVADALKAL